MLLIIIVALQAAAAQSRIWPLAWLAVALLWWPMRPRPRVQWPPQPPPPRRRHPAMGRGVAYALAYATGWVDGRLGISIGKQVHPYARIVAMFVAGAATAVRAVDLIDGRLATHP